VVSVVNAAKLAIKKKASKQLLFKDDGKVRRYTYPVSWFCKKNKARLRAKNNTELSRLCSPLLQAFLECKSERLMEQFAYKP